MTATNTKPKALWCSAGGAMYDDRVFAQAKDANEFRVKCHCGRVIKPRWHKPSDGFQIPSHRAAK